MSVRRLFLVFLLVGACWPCPCRPPPLTRLARAHSGRWPSGRPGAHFGASTCIAGRVVWVTVNCKQMPPG